MKDHPTSAVNREDRLEAPPARRPVPIVDPSLRQERRTPRVPVKAPQLPPWGSGRVH